MGMWLTVLPVSVTSGMGHSFSLVPFSDEGFLLFPKAYKRVFNFIISSFHLKFLPLYFLASSCYSICMAEKAACPLCLCFLCAVKIAHLSLPCS